jgi:hypothetical protein
MFFFVSRILSITVLAAVAIGLVREIRAEESVPLQLSTDLSVDVLGLSGHTYRLESSTDLLTWEFVSPVRRFGVGTSIQNPVPLEGTEGKFFRYVIDRQPSGGLAPWSIGGRTWMLNSMGNVARYSFLNATTGSLLDVGKVVPSLFTYTMTRTGEATLKLVITLSNGNLRTLETAFTTATLGSFTQIDQRQGIMLETAAGAFGDAIQPPLQPLSWAPSGIKGKSLLLINGTTPSLVNVSTKNQLTLQRNGTTAAANGTYTKTTATEGILSLQTAGQLSEVYKLSFTSNQGGRFHRTVTQPNLPKDEDTGVFLLE